MEKHSKIYVAGHKGLVGSSILKNLQQKGYLNLITRSRNQLNLLDAVAVEKFFSTEKPEYVFLAAAKVGGILANNKYRADFIYENLTIQNNVIYQSYKNDVKKLLFLGSTCVYPKNAEQPIKEEYLLTDMFEYTNEPYAIAKIAGIKMCESYNIQYETNFLSVMPTNLYGPNDNFDLETSHVLPALIKKIHLAKLLSEGKFEEIGKILGVGSSKINDTLKSYGITSKNVEIWGSGKPLREFLYSEDMADACVYLMQNVDFKDYINNTKEIRNTHINIGSGKEISIADLAQLIKKIVGFKGNLTFDTAKPDGTLRKLTDVSKLNQLGWEYKIDLEEGIERLYKWYVKNNVEDKFL